MSVTLILIATCTTFMKRPSPPGADDIFSAFHLLAPFLSLVCCCSFYSVCPTSPGVSPHLPEIASLSWIQAPRWPSSWPLQRYSQLFFLSDGWSCRLFVSVDTASALLVHINYILKYLKGQASANNVNSNNQDPCYLLVNVRLFTWVLYKLQNAQGWDWVSEDQSAEQLGWS